MNINENPSYQNSGLNKLETTPYSMIMIEWYNNKLSFLDSYIVITHFIPAKSDMLPSRKPRSWEIQSEHCNIWREQNYSSFTAICPASTVKIIAPSQHKPTNLKWRNL